jgi:hypothetical protein
MIRHVSEARNHEFYSHFLLFSTTTKVPAIVQKFYRNQLLRYLTGARLILPLRVMVVASLRVIASNSAAN